MASTPAALQAAAQPAHPKMPANAFANYCQTRSITDGCSDWQVYAKDWANLSGTDRTPYVSEAAALLAEYQKKVKERGITLRRPHLLRTRALHATRSRSLGEVQSDGGERGTTLHQYTLVLVS